MVKFTRAKQVASHLKCKVSCEGATLNGQVFPLNLTRPGRPLPLLPSVCSGPWPTLAPRAPVPLPQRQPVGPAPSWLLDPSGPVSARLWLLRLDPRRACLKLPAPPSLPPLLFPPILWHALYLVAVRWGVSDKPPLSYSLFCRTLLTAASVELIFSKERVGSWGSGRWRLIVRCSRQVYAPGGDRAEAQHGRQEAVHPGAQREDLPVPGHERRLPDGVAAGGTRAAAAPPAQPLLGKEEGNHQEALIFHRYRCCPGLHSDARPPVPSVSAAARL